ncbi:MAG TPA: hypothetical protein VM677_32930 [Actinokineospora sp.]|nr:hypothetical protein [Actinokineospora sp.]
MPCNEIQFDYRICDGRDVFEVVPRVDGMPLTELIDRFEIGAQMMPAGNAYGGLIPLFFRFGPMNQHFHGRSTGAMGPKTPVLGCECGEWGCWPLMAHIIVTDELVTWDCFEQPHRDTRDYTGFGPFRFDRHHYDRALQDLTNAMSSNE